MPTGSIALARGRGGVPLRPLFLSKTPVFKPIAACFGLDKERANVVELLDTQNGSGKLYKEEIL
ncbi:MAG TPA: hypothetical protein DDW94_01585 [Deltaproteobacteria bacterium]|nr:MAG: hypothetical protein A2Z79_07805 [Deltaproteobacteria bacterium GWA2_55_82]OGQ65133.1 MAG: hypothetical protein A3I81_07225 [Deltaproteobacteria bacterium RIFCSPLOWO2_02_FULL_55_12]HBG45665.1 hypothetical protein [Deltaproteobacteria bacterium]HCY12142.1 hypothetical protein [Deltaproteobacteria bacterium]